MTRKLVVLCAIFLCVPQTSFAYVDPGTGAYVIQAVAALVGAAVFYVSHPRELIKRIRDRILKRKDPS